MFHLVLQGEGSPEVALFMRDAGCRRPASSGPPADGFHGGSKYPIIAVPGSRNHIYNMVCRNLKPEINIWYLHPLACGTARHKGPPRTSRSRPSRCGRLSSTVSTAWPESGDYVLRILNMPRGSIY